MDFLQQMAQKSRERVAAGRRLYSEVSMVQLAINTPLPAPLLLSAGGFDLIAEIKLRSPAMGALKTADEDIDARAAAYAAAGAAAVSVLTEPSRFDGSMAHLKSAARTLAAQRVPAMRKDFLVDSWQVAEARAAGAGGVLVILRMLPRGVLDELLDMARRLKLFVLLEAFDEHDIELAHRLIESPSAPLLVGVNCRDLATLQVVPGRLEQLVSLLPASVPRVAESGVESAADAARVAGAGYQMALVGGALMKAGDPQALVRDLLAAGRQA